MDMPADFDYEQLDPGIRKTVRWLRENGFDTTDSGDGRTKTGTMECALDMPNVAIAIAPYELFSAADRLWALICRTVPRLAEEVHIEASYDPMDRSCVLLLLRLHDGMLTW